MKTTVGDYKDIDYAIDLLKSGEVVAFPTETVYGLGADCFNITAIQKIFLAKGRPQDNPLIVHIANTSMLPLVARDIPEIAYKIFKEVSPAPLTLILKKNLDVPGLTTANLDTVGIRIPDHPMALELIRRSNIPLAAPSANTSGRVSPTSANHVLEDMDTKIPLILDGGAAAVGVESTIVDLTQEIPKILRPGAVTLEKLKKYLPDIVYASQTMTEKAICPGMKYTHYKPISDCVIAATLKDAQNYYDKESASRKVVIVGRESYIKDIGNRNAISLGISYKDCMANIFGTLRLLEKEVDLIILESFPHIDSAMALVNRLEKSSGHHIIGDI